MVKGIYDNRMRGSGCNESIKDGAFWVNGADRNEIIIGQNRIKIIIEHEIRVDEDPAL